MEKGKKEKEENLFDDTNDIRSVKLLKCQKEFMHKWVMHLWHKRKWHQIDKLSKPNPILNFIPLLLPYLNSLAWLGLLAQLVKASC